MKHTSLPFETAEISELGLDANYETRLLTQVRSCLETKPLRFSEIVRACQGAYPTAVAMMLNRLRPERTQEKMYLIRNSRVPSVNEKTFSALSEIEGNPVLCSWYFTPNTCRRIELLQDWSGLRLAFLGAPRLYEWFKTKNLGNRRILLDADPLVLEKLSRVLGCSDELMFYDCNSPMPANLETNFDVVFFDPPWYLENYFLWFHRARELAPAGTIVCSLFPELTRPGADLERREFKTWVAGQGSRLTSLDAFVDYEIPTFEATALCECGLYNLASWKVADLLILELSGIRGAPKETVVECAQSSTRSWQEVDIGTLRFFVDLSRVPIVGGSLLEPAARGRIVLTSPSRRSALRQAANILTSRGHALSTPRPVEFIQLLKALNGALSARASSKTALKRLPVDRDAASLLLQILNESRHA